MFHRIRAVVVALAMGAGALALAPAANAATTAPPAMSKLAVSPASPIDVTAAPVKVTVTFDTTGAKGTPSLKLTGPGSPSDVRGPYKVDEGGGKEFWRATAVFDADNVGTWTVAATAANSDGNNTNTATFAIALKSKLDTKIVDFDADPDVVAKGATLTVTGQLLRERSGWKGYEGQPVKIQFRAKGTDAYADVTTVTTGGSGHFKAAVKAEATGYWRAHFAGNSGANASTSDSDGVAVKEADAPSRLSLDAYPEPVDKGDRLNFKGALQIFGKGGWDGDSGYRVAIQFKRSGSDHWEHVTTATTGHDGRYWARATAVASGWWRAVFAGASGVEGSASAPDWVTVKRPTPPPPPSKMSSSIVSFNAYPEPVKKGKWLHFKGRLLVHDGRWEGYEAQVGLYYWSKGKWRFVKTTWSNDNGYLHTKVKAVKSGYWKFYFRGDAEAKSDSSRKDYVKVKR